MLTKDVIKMLDKMNEPIADYCVRSKCNSAECAAVLRIVAAWAMRQAEINDQGIETGEHCDHDQINKWLSKLDNAHR